jgi:hypothetical protein
MSEVAKSVLQPHLGCDFLNMGLIDVSMASGTDFTA